jgi:hypothetical protein
LEPYQRVTLHIEIGHIKELGNNSLIVIKELICLISPSSGIITIKPGKKKNQVSQCGYVYVSLSLSLSLSPPISLLQYHCLQTLPDSSFLHGHDYLGFETTTRCDVDVLEVGDFGLPLGFSTYHIPSSTSTGNQYFGLHGELHATGENLDIFCGC